MSDGDQPAQPEAKPSEFDRFRDLTRKLVKVPKREIDAERARNGEDKK